jgi:hypothetical protein
MVCEGLHLPFAFLNGKVKRVLDRLHGLWQLSQPLVSQ